MTEKLTIPQGLIIDEAELNHNGTAACQGPSVVKLELS